MKKLLTSLLLIASITFGMTGCNKTKTLATIRQADELSAKMLIYARNIAKANNDSFVAGNISSTVHLTTNQAVDTFLKGIDAYNQAVAAAKQAIANGADPPSRLQILEDVFSSQVVGAGLALARLAVNVPPALAEKIGGWAEAIQLALVAFEGLFAQLKTEVVNANG